MTGSLLSVDFTTDHIYIHDGATNSLIGSFASPSAVPYAITKDLENNIITSDDNNYIYTHSGLSSTLTGSFTIPTNDIMGLAVDSGNNLYSSYEDRGQIIIHSGISSTITGSMAGGLRGMAFDSNGNLISTAYLSSQSIWAVFHDGNSASLTGSTHIGNLNVIGLGLDSDNNMIVTDALANYIYIHDGSTSTITGSFAAPNGNPGGVYYSDGLHKNQNPTESVSISDTKNIDFSTIKTESLSVTDSPYKDVSKPLTNSFSITDSTSSMLVVIKLLTENISLSDNISRVWTAKLMPTESVAVADSISRVWDAKIINAEALSVSDSASAINIFIRSFNESVSISENIIKDINTILSEDVSVDDALISVRGKFKTLNETFTTTMELVGYNLSIRKTLSEDIELAESLKWIGNIGRNLRRIDRILNDDVSDTFNIGSQILQDDITVGSVFK